jgi:outer membrane protein TolC
LGVQRFLGEVRKNESQRLIVRQRIIEVENRINFLVGRYPQAVERESWDFIKLDSRSLSAGVPAELLLNRRDIRAAERELAAAGLDVLVARARFFPRLNITAGVGFEAFNPRYLFDPGAFIGYAAGELVGPLINKKAIRADYLSANARQLQAVYNYQRTVLNAFTEVTNRLTKVDNYRRSVAIKQEQVTALEKSVSIASDLFNQVRAEYMDVLFAQRDLLDARRVLIETKQQQLSAIVNAYQALGGGYLLSSGSGYAEVYCPPADVDPDSVFLAPVPYEAMMNCGPGKISVSPTPEDGMLPPVPSGENSPSPYDEGPQSAPGRATLSPDSGDAPPVPNDDSR